MLRGRQPAEFGSAASACPRPSGASSPARSADKLRPPAGTPVWPMIDSHARPPGSHRLAAVPPPVVELLHLLPLVLSPASGSAALRAHARDPRGPDRVDHRILRGLLHGYQTAGRVERRSAGTQADPAGGRHALPRLAAALSVEPDRGRAARRAAPARGGHGLLPGRRRGDGRRSLTAGPPGRGHGLLGRRRQCGAGLGPSLRHLDRGPLGLRCAVPRLGVRGALRPSPDRGEQRDSRRARRLALCVELVC